MADTTTHLLSFFSQQCPHVVRDISCHRFAIFW